MYLEFGERLGKIFYANEGGKNYLDGCTRNERVFTKALVSLGTELSAT